MIYLVCGDEEFLMDRKVDEIKNSHLLNGVIRYSYPEQWDLFLSEFQFGMERSEYLYVLDSTVSKFQHKIPDSELHIVVIAKNKTSYQNPDEIFEFPQLKTYSDKNEVVRWIVEEGQKFNIDLKPYANALFLNCGNCLRKLNSEIEKISQIEGSGSKVSPDVLRKVLSFSADLNPQPIVEAVYERQPRKAIAFLRKLQENKDETGWVLSYLIRSVYNSIVIEMHGGSSSSSLASILGIHPYVFSKVWEKRRGNWKLSFLLDHHSRLLDLDAYHKRGGKWHKERLEKLVLELCTQGR